MPCLALGFSWLGLACLVIDIDTDANTGEAIDTDEHAGTDKDRQTLHEQPYK